MSFTLFPLKERKWDLFIPRNLDEVWAFFSRPENLDRITPAEMKFEILSGLEGLHMYEGMLIRYKVSPLLGIKMNWVTEITHLKDQTYFIDEQRFGPYTFWHHQHHFQAVEGGVRMQDILHYKVPLGPIGKLVEELFIDRQIDKIFDFREKAVKRIFGF